MDLTAALLAHRRGSLPADTLLDLVWPDQATRLEPSVVHTAVARLRRSWGPGSITRDARGYRLGAEVDTDEDAFIAHLQRARRAGTSAAALAAYDAAVALWRPGPAYGGASEELVGPDRARLAQQRDEARLALTQLLVDAEDAAAHERALAEARALLGDNPLLEPAHELLITALARLGRQAEALAAYDSLRLTLRDELGIDPGPTAADLHGRLLSQDPQLVMPRPRTPRLELSRSRPPAPLTSLVGREAAIEQIGVAVGRRRLVTLTGPGGVGKTRLAGEVLRQLERDLPPDTLTGYLDLSALETAETGEVVDGLARALGLPSRGEGGVSALSATLEGREAVAVVDEAERHLAACRAVLGPLLADCPGLRLLVTSREPLELSGEQLIDTPPLEVPAPAAGTSEILASPAVRLLVDRIEDRTGPLRVEDQAAGELGRLVRQVDGMPLALELLARQASAQPLAALTELARRPLSLSGEPDRNPRHRSLRDTVADSVEVLPPEQRRVLECLGVFAARFDEPAAQAVAGGGSQVREILHDLVRRSLVRVQRDDAGLGMRLLAPVRELSLEGLAARGEVAECRRRHRRWYADRWRDAPRSDALLISVRDNYADHLLALRTALEDQDGAPLADLAIALARVWAVADHHEPARRWLTRVLDSGLLDKTADARVRALRATLLVHRDGAVAAQDLETAALALEEAGDDRWLTTVRLNQGVLYADRGDYPRARETGAAAVALARTVDDERVAETVSILALWTALVTPAAAPPLIDEAWALANATGSTISLESAVNNLFIAEMQLGRVDRARRLLDQAAARAVPHAPPPFLVIARGWSALYAGDPRAAARLMGTLVPAQGGDASDTYAAEIFTCLGRALVDLGEPTGDLLLAGAAEVLERHGTVLVPWQRPTRVPGRGGLPAVTSSQALGAWLADVARAAVRAVEGSADVSGSGHAPRGS